METLKMKTTIPLITKDELEIFDNHIHEIIEEYTKMNLKEKEQILTQRIIKKQEEEILELKRRIDNCKKYLKFIEDHDFSCEIPNAILDNDIHEIKKYINDLKESYKNMYGKDIVSKEAQLLSKLGY